MSQNKSTSIPATEARPDTSELVADIRGLIETARRNTAVAVNAELTLLYWGIGRRINLDLLGNKRGEYGKRIVVSVSRQLSWSHFLALIPLDKPLQRDFYAEMCRIESWSVRTLRAKIRSMLYERTAISKKPDEVARKDGEGALHWSRQVVA